MIRYRGYYIFFTGEKIPKDVPLFGNITYFVSKEMHDLIEELLEKNKLLEAELPNSEEIQFQGPTIEETEAHLRAAYGLSPEEKE